MTDQSAECAVVGLGLIGAAATRHLAEAGVTVVGIGPLEPADWAGHQGAFSSHYDSGRIARILDERFEWAELARRSILAYGPLAARTGIEFHRPVGVLDARSAPRQLEAIRAVGARLAVDYEEREPSVAAPFYRLPPETVVMHEAGPAGFIDPRAMVRAQHAAASEAGATLIHAEVDSWEESTTGVTLELRDGEALTVDTLLIAAGAYSRRFLPQLSFTVKAEITILAEVEDPPEHVPALLYDIQHERLDSIYVVPPTRYPDGKSYVKLGANSDADRWPGDEEAMSDWMRSDAIESGREVFQDVLSALVPGVSTANILMKPCLVTYTTHRLPYVDRLGARVFVAAGGNGQGAKSADAIGALAAGLVRRGEWTDPLPAEAFRAV